MIKVRPFKTTDMLISEAQELLRTTLTSAGNLMLSGGSTPYAIYNQLTSNPCPVHPDRWLFLSDERMVPYDSPQSNTGNLLPMLKALECADRFVRVETSLTAPEAADRLSRDLEPLSAIDLGFLGIGNDGHTAGLFTLEQARLKPDVLALHTDRPDGMKGITVTPAVFNRAKQLILLVSGEAKRDITTTLLNHPESLPAGIALAEHPDVTVWTDIIGL